MIVCWALFLLVLSSISSREAIAVEPPPLIPLQGQLLASDGSPLVGPVNLAIAIWDSPSGSGTQIYREDQLNVGLTNGVYNVTVGQGTNQSGSLTQVGASPGRWLEISINGLPQAPRLRVTAVPFALISRDANTLNGNALAQVLTQMQGPKGPAGTVQ